MSTHVQFPSRRLCSVLNVGERQRCGALCRPCLRWEGAFLSSDACHDTTVQEHFPAEKGSSGRTVHFVPLVIKQMLRRTRESALLATLSLCTTFSLALFSGYHLDIETRVSINITNIFLNNNNFLKILFSYLRKKKKNIFDCFTLVRCNSSFIICSGICGPSQMHQMEVGSIVLAWAGTQREGVLAGTAVR